MKRLIREMGLMTGRSHSSTASILSTEMLIRGTTLISCIVPHLSIACRLPAALMLWLLPSTYIHYSSHSPILTQCVNDFASHKMSLINRND